MFNQKILKHLNIFIYPTDYIESFVCAIYAAILLIKSRDKPRDKSTIAVVIIQSAVSISALTGGLTHQYLQKVCFLSNYLFINFLIC